MDEWVEELFPSLPLSVVLSVMFTSYFLVIFPISFETAVEDNECLFPLDGVLQQLRFQGQSCFTSLQQILSEHWRVFIVTSLELFTQIWSMIKSVCVLTKEFMVFGDHMLHALNLLNSCKLQLLCCIVITYLVYTTYRENVVYSRLVKELKTVQGIMNYQSWQVDVYGPEMEALTSRLLKNKESRIPGICRQLEVLYSVLDNLHCQYLKLEEEFTMWKPTMTNQTNKLRKLNQMLQQETGSKTVRDIRKIGFYAGQRVSETAEKLHDRIEEVKGVLEETSKLMDIKGLPMRVEW